MSWGRGPLAGLLLIAVLVVAVVLIGYYIVLPLPWAWVGLAATLVVFVALLGLANTGNFLGALVDERNMYSLSRLQIVIWTVVVLSALAALGLARLRGQAVDPFAIQVPEELWLAIGITATALVGSPIIRSTKSTRTKTPDGGEALGTFQARGLAPADTDEAAAMLNARLRGVIVVNPVPAEATWLDLFRGEEAGNAGVLDVGKIQMFFFTVLVVFGYAIAIWTAFAAAAPASLPELGPAMVTLLALSNGTYLANKAAPHTTQL